MKMKKSLKDNNRDKWLPPSLLVRSFISSPTPLLCHFSPIFLSVFPLFYALRLTVVSNPFDSLTFLIQNFILARMLHFPIDFTTSFVDAVEQANFLLQDVLLLDNPRWSRKFVGNTALLCSEEAQKKTQCERVKKQQREQGKWIF